MERILPQKCPWLNPALTSVYMDKYRRPPVAHGEMGWGHYVSRPPFPAVFALKKAQLEILASCTSLLTLITQ